MRIVITGATGNAGTSVIEALQQSPDVEEIVGLARRRPATPPPGKLTWLEANVLGEGLVEIFEGADAVIHLAWAIQPSHDEATLERINVEGSRRVFEAAAAAGVAKLVYASSVGVYSKGPKDREVSESWPTEGTPSSFYSRHKVAVERLLDRFEGEHAEMKVVRLRPALIFKGDAATEIRRLFAGPFLPNFLLDSRWIPFVPRLSGLRFQAVHSADVGRAYAQAVLRDVRGAFNVAAEPPIDSDDLAELLEARTFPVPISLARRLADLSWRLRLQPSPPGWLDMALGVPLMSTERARRELEWAPDVSGIEALRELLAGMRTGESHPTPPLQSGGPAGRVDELRTGVGGRQWAKQPEEQLVKHLADVHSIEEQALTQMRAAPEIAGDERLAAIFRQHLSETEEHEQRVRECLEAHDADTSKLKDLAGKAGGLGMLAFAQTQPDTPGKLSMHAFSYEHMELAAYELLRREAEAMGDEQTAELAREIAGEEQRMADRIEEHFDVAVEASLREVEPDDLGAQLDTYLADAHALEQQALQLLESAPKLVGDEQLEEVLREHLEQTRRHEERVSGRLEERGASSSALKDAALRLGGLNLGGFLGSQPDVNAKIAGFAFAFEHLEIAAYELLRRVAERAGDERTVTLASEIVDEEREAARRVAATWDRATVSLGTA
ncbi:MAG TPA: DUF892 family protein [Solirubrobacterales bacterium]|nr:DUF892 family protein [Solirubrobacterales bacterium]